jgi:ABC-2 type transport system ATP-binding protein
LSEVQAVCERIIIIDKGKIIANELTSDITRVLEDSRTLKLKICASPDVVLPLLSGKSGISSAEALPERDSDSYSYAVKSERGIDVRKAIFRICADANLPLIEMAPVGEELEDIFIRLIDRDTKSKNKR